MENLGSDGIWGCEGGDKAVALAEGGKVCNSLNYCLWWGEGCGRTIRMVSLEAGGSPVSMRPGLVGRRLPFLLGPKVQPYLPELMECMLQPLRNTSTPRAKELAVSALGAIATAAQASLLPYFPTIMEHLQKFLVTGHDDLQPVRIQSLGEEGAPRQGFQCQERASAHLLFIETSPGAA